MTIRLLLADDQHLVRAGLAALLNLEADLEVVHQLADGRDIVEHCRTHMVDVAVLDIEMPDMDGISALPLLLEKKRNLVIIMASTLTRRNAEISFKALSLGASDYIPKPESTREISAADIFKRDLIEKIHHLGARLRRPAVVASPSLSPAAQPVRAPLPRTSAGTMPPVAQPNG